MTDVRLQTLIEKAFEDRATINAADEGRCARCGGRGARSARPRQGAGGGEAARRERRRIRGRSINGSRRRCCCRFRLNDNVLIEGGPGQATWWDKVPSKFDGWGENRFADAGFRAVPGAIVRRSAYHRAATSC